MFCFSILVLADSYEEWKVKVQFMVRMLGNLGFLINETKSKMEQTQQVIYLGFVWDLDNWRLSLKPVR